MEAPLRPIEVAKIQAYTALGSYVFGFASRYLEAQDQKPKSWTPAALWINFLILLFVAYYTRDRIRLWVGMTMDIVVAVWAMRIGLSPL